MVAAARELHEECGLDAGKVLFADAPFTVSDVIKPDPEQAEPGSAFHYIIAQTFCRTRQASDSEALSAGDDAGDARWYSINEMESLDSEQRLSSGVIDVVRRGLLLHERGLLPTDVSDPQ